MRFCESRFSSIPPTKVSNPSWKQWGNLLQAMICASACCPGIQGKQMDNWIETHCFALTQKALSDAIFSGRILYFERLKPMAEAVKEVQDLLHAVFEPHNPESAHEFLQIDE